MNGKNRIKTMMTAVLAALILTLIPASAVLAGDTVTPKYSDEELYRIYDELLDEYMNDSKPDDVFAVTGIGVGGAVINGQTTGFGESGQEKRVVVTVRYQYYEEYKKKIEDKYGDAVYVEYSESSKAEYDSQNISFDDGTGTGADPSAQTGDTRPINDGSTRGTGTSATTQIVAGVILAAVAGVAIYFYVKNGKKSAKNKKKNKR